MKRPGDEQPPSAQRAAKLQKSVTFSLEPSHKHPRQRQVSSSVSSSNTNNQPSSTMTGTTQPQSQTQSQASSNSTMERRSILRSASSSLSGTSPRFTFDFVDDASLGTLSASRRSTYSSPNNRNQQNQRSRGNNKLSPSRLDARYSSRLPPSYHGQSPNNASHQHHYQRSYSSSAAGEEIKRNLFGGSEAIAMDEGSDSMMDDTSAGSGFNSGPNTPSSAQRGQRSSAPSSYSRTPSSSGTSPRYGHSYGYSYRQSPSPSNRSNNNNLSVATSSAISSRSSGTTPSTFMSNSPRKRGGVTGVTSPLSGNLGHASVASSAASSPANSCYNGGHNNGGNIMMVDYEARGAGDRFIPSRALSNLNFELKTGTGGARHSGGNSAHGNGTAGGNNHGNDNGNRAGNRGDTNGNGGASDAGGNNIAGVDLNPAPSFGATMMGGAPPVDDPAAAPGANATGAGPDGGQPGIASTFSDDAASNDGTSDHRHDATNRQPLLYDALLRSEMLGENVDPAMHSVQSPTGLINSGSSSMNGGGNGNGMGMGGGLGNGGNHPNNVVTPFRERSNNLRFSPCNGHGQFYSNGGGMNHRRNERASIVNSFRLSPVSMSPNQRTNLGSYTERCKRKIAKVPTKVLDAPALQDDYYLNLVDWSSQNVLAVGLGSCVYLWSAATSRVTQLCDLSSTEDAVTSVAWSEGGRHLAIGSTRGDVQLWDASAQKLIRTMHGHSARVGALSWKLSGAGGSAGSSSLLASGSRDRLIHLRDPRSDQPYEMRLCGHKQEVCGLRWSFDERSMLASGGNDNKLLVWDVKKHTQPYHTFSDHTAAVKAIAWSPHQHGLLASGGGTADRCIRFWNCLTGHGINCIDTGSQVCNLAFSKNCNELVSTHGYSLNQIVVWKYPSMQKIATLTGHTYRVLYLALSPDGSTIVTGAGDETLRFWQVFPGPQKENKAGGLLFPAGMAGSVIR